MRDKRLKQNIKSKFWGRKNIVMYLKKQRRNGWNKFEEIEARSGRNHEVTVKFDKLWTWKIVGSH